jgi:glycosyltransferase involved in cell wall biosynthesis
VDLAIRALADSRCDSWSLLTIGDDDPSAPGERQRLLALATDLSVSERVCLPGAIPHAGRLLGAMDAVGVLTRPGEAGAPAKEGYGIVATEAMLAEVPVIVAQDGPISRRLDTPEGPAGITLAAPTPEDLSQALSVLSDPGTREQMGRRGALFARTLPDSDDVARAFADVLAPFRRP